MVDRKTEIAYITSYLTQYNYAAIFADDPQKVFSVYLLYREQSICTAGDGFYD